MRTACCRWTTRRGFLSRVAPGFRPVPPALCSLHAATFAAPLRLPCTQPNLGCRVALSIPGPAAAGADGHLRRHRVPQCSQRGAQRQQRVWRRRRRPEIRGAGGEAVGRHERHRGQRAAEPHGEREVRGRAECGSERDQHESGSVPVAPLPAALSGAPAGAGGLGAAGAHAPRGGRTVRGRLQPRGAAAESGPAARHLPGVVRSRPAPGLLPACATSRLRRFWFCPKRLLRRASAAVRC